MPIPGLYFIGKCTQKDCTYFLRQVPLYLGSQGTFDIARMKSISKCGGCDNQISKIINILFVNCIWTYKGKKQDGVKISSSEETTVNKLEYFPFSKGTVWDWLVIKVRPIHKLSGQRETKNQDVQTENIELNSSVNLDEVIIEALSNQAKKYSEKYHKAKAKLDKIMKKMRVEEAI